MRLSNPSNIERRNQVQTKNLALFERQPTANCNKQTSWKLTRVDRNGPTAFTGTISVAAVKKSKNNDSFPVILIKLLPIEVYRRLLLICLCKSSIGTIHGIILCNHRDCSNDSQDQLIWRIVRSIKAYWSSHFHWETQNLSAPNSDVWKNVRYTAWNGSPGYMMQNKTLG